jgi:hypothetical protein
MGIEMTFHSNSLVLRPSPFNTTTAAAMIVAAVAADPFPCDAADTPSPTPMRERHGSAPTSFRCLDNPTT